MKYPPRIYRSQRLDFLVDPLIENFNGKGVVLVPSGYIKQWLSLEIAKKKGIFLGMKLLTPQEFLPRSLNSLEMYCLLHKACQESCDPELLAYLDGKPKRLNDLVLQLSALFHRYGQHGSTLFSLKKNPDWQEKILQDLFVKGPWRLPVQFLNEVPLPNLGPVHCFGIDCLPPVVWDYLFRFPALSIYLFSPCAEYWGDVSTEREKRALLKKKISSGVRNKLDEYLGEAPPLLASWGKLGRETDRILDRFQLVDQEAYADPDEGTLLKNLQNQCLYFQNSGKLAAEDDSLRILLTGSSRLREIEILRDQILQLAEKGVSFQDISILAPQLDPYISLIEYVFAEAQIPYRIQGNEMGRQSSFYQGLLRILKLANGRWETEELLALFETPSFYKKQGWEEERRENYRDWISKGKIEWGLDERHRQAILGPKDDLAQGTWEEGFDRFLNDLIYLFPQTRKLGIQEEDFEALLLFFRSLKKDLELFQQNASLASWAQAVEHLAAEYLTIDEEDEADAAAVSSFRRYIRDLREADIRLASPLFPFEPLLQFLDRSYPGQIHGSLLHAVRIAPLEEAAQIPAKAVFLIGMDEESFPRLPSRTSLDLLKEEKIPELSDKDRYLFLQALFSAGEYLRISYGHLSPDEGKPVGPSIVVQELLAQIENPPIVTPPSNPFDPKCFASGESRSLSDYRIAQILQGPRRKLSFWPDLSFCPAPYWPENETILSLAELSSFVRHPWKYFLQKVHGMYLNESLDETFNLQRAVMARSHFSGQPLDGLPHGLLGKALEQEIQEKAAGWKENLKEKVFAIHFRDRCKERKWESPDCLVLPPIEVGKVRLVGEVRLATQRGLVFLGKDGIDSLLKAWPEALAAALATGSPEILMLDSGKAKVIEQPEASLKKLLEYYFRCRETAPPLIPQWADALLRKDASSLQKAIDKEKFEDPFFQWVEKRTEIPEAEAIFENWAKYLRDVLFSLAALYPTRNSDAAV